MDVVGPFPTGITQHQYTCVFVDAISRYTHTYAMLNKSANSLAQLLCSFIARLGCPNILINDNGLEFINKVVKSVTDLMKIEYFSVTAYRPSANGLVKSHKREVGRTLRYLVADDSLHWQAIFPTAELCLNIAYNASLRDTPFLLVYGQDSVLRYTVLINSQQLLNYSTKQYCVYLLNLLKRVMDTIERFLKSANEKPLCG
ncbi:KRAB-A domain-containing protein 2-like [Palaemon carinicauda]|uniref:KRAB-A domain-containing protein 2-like n=1 Tax=Palaemon carinicauda TaxID=392227 RepID=UPI0035B65827